MKPVNRNQNSTKVYFRKGCVAEHLPTLIASAHTVLLAYGGGSIKKNGVYDEIAATLGTAATSRKMSQTIWPRP